MSLRVFVPAVPDPYPPALAPPWTKTGHSNPYPWYQHMVSQRPLAYDSDAGLWHVCGYMEVHAHLKDWVHWSTAKRMEMIPVEERVIRLLTSDPPLHIALRKHFSHAYRVRRIATMEKHIRLACRALIGVCVRRRSFDVTRDLAMVLTTQLIAELIGIDLSSLAVGLAFQGRLGPIVADGKSPTLNMGGFDPAFHRRAMAFFADLIVDRRRQPRDDLVSDLARLPEAEMEGKLDVGALLVEQFGAGYKTTTHLLGNMLCLLAENPDQLAMIRQRPELVPMAVEETIRLCGPIQARPRIATQPVDASGGVIPEGSVALLWIQAANLDPDRFQDPLRFDVSRTEDSHLDFGLGEHFCLGANLARMEARVFLEEFLDAVRSYRIVSPHPVSLVDDFILRGPEALEIEVTPA